MSVRHVGTLAGHLASSWPFTASSNTITPFLSERRPFPSETHHSYVSNRTRSLNGTKIVHSASSWPCAWWWARAKLRNRVNIVKRLAVMMHLLVHTDFNTQTVMAVNHAELIHGGHSATQSSGEGTPWMTAEDSRIWLPLRGQPCGRALRMFQGVRAPAGV